MLTAPISSAANAGAVPGVDTTGALPVQVFIDALTPRVVRPHTQVVVQGRLRNVSTDAIADVRVRIRVRTHPVGSRSELATDAVRTDAIGLPQSATETPVAATIGSNATLPFRLQVSADSLQLHEFGVYPFDVEALGSDAVGPNDVVGRTPTFLPWVPAGGGFRPTRVAWVLPLVDAPNRAATTTFPDDHLATAVASGGRLNTVLMAGTRAGPGTVRATARGRRVPPDAQRAVPVTWAVDPALLQSLADMSDGYRVVTRGGRNSKQGAGQIAAATWLDALRRALRAGPVGDTVLSLPYANADVAALVRAGMDADLATAMSHGRDVTTSVTGVAPDASLALPPGGFVTTKAVADLVANGADHVVLSDAAMPPTTSLIYTPNAGAPVSPGSDGTTALLYDGTLARITATADRSTLAAAAVPPPITTATPSPDVDAATPSPEPQAPTAVPMTARLLEQRFLAETALITAERPLDSRDVVVTVPQTWDPVPGLATALVADTGRVPWMAPTPITDMSADDSVERSPLTYPESAENAELPQSYLADSRDSVRALRRELTEFRSILAPPVGPTAVSLNDATLRTESAAWRANLGEGLAVRQEVADNLAAQSSAVNISSSQRLITLASRRGTIPITISNGLDQAVVVGLQVTAVSSARLAAPATTAQTIAAGRKLTVEVKAVVNQAGLFPVRAQLLTPTGAPYGPSVTLRLRSTAYGQLAIGITAGALGALLLAIVLRFVRRRRHNHDDTVGGTIAGAAGEAT